MCRDPRDFCLGILFYLEFLLNSHCLTLIFFPQVALRFLFSNPGPPLSLTLLHSEWPKLHRVSAIPSAIGLNGVNMELISSENGLLIITCISLLEG